MDRISVFYLPPYFSFSAWYNGMTRPKWMRESRPYVVYGMRRGTHTSTSDGIYIGVTSRPLHVRLREHVAQATQGSKCPLHVAMREVEDVGVLIKKGMYWVRVLVLGYSVG